MAVIAARCRLCWNTVVRWADGWDHMLIGVPQHTIMPADMWFWGEGRDRVEAPLRGYL